MPTHTERRDGNHLFKTQLQSLKMPGPLDGAPDAPAAGHPLCHFIPHYGRSGQL
jgi:hypothetical protein